MAGRCKNCGGLLVYDIPSGTVKCRYCDTQFAPEEFADEAALEEKTFHWAEEEQEEGYQIPSVNVTETVYLCPTCGAEVTASEFEAVDYCLYCGSFVTLEKRMKQIRQPERIIPFSKSEEECRQIYRKNLQHKLFAPKEFRDEKFIDNMRGVYIPFWDYEYKYGPHVTVKGSSEERHGDYVHTTHFRTKCDVEGTVDNVSYDASSMFDDAISEQIAPYEKAHMKPYAPSYMFGFYGNAADIDEKVYRAASDEEVENKIWESVVHAPGVSKGHPEGSKPKSFNRDFHVRKNVSLAMLPVWLLTWRKGDRVAYSAINGDTGEMYGEIPVDIGRYLLFSLLTAIPLFFLLNAAVTFSAAAMLWMALILSFVMVMMYVFQLDRIVRRVMHTDDRGFLARHEEARQANEDHVDENILGIVWEWIIDLFTGGTWFYMVIAVVSITVTYFAYVSIAFILVALLVPIYTLYRIYKNEKILQDKTVWLDVVGAMAAVLLSVILLAFDPAGDVFYYVGGIVCMLGVAATAVRMVRRYNDLITRPVPSFWDRKEG